MVANLRSSVDPVIIFISSSGRVRPASWIFLSNWSVQNHGVGFYAISFGFVGGCNSAGPICIRRHNNNRLSSQVRGFLLFYTCEIAVQIKEEPFQTRFFLHGCALAVFIGEYILYTAKIRTYQERSFVMLAIFLKKLFNRRAVFLIRAKAYGTKCN